MKLLLPIALFAAAVAAADCEAETIVETCLESENKKFEACGDTEYDCQCAAQEAIATCYNNCPNDSRIEQAQGQVKIYCDNASLYGSSTTAKATQSASGTSDSAKPTTTSDSSSTSTSTDDADADSEDSEDGEDSGSAGGLMLNAGAVMAAVAGVMAVVV